MDTPGTDGRSYGIVFYHCRNESFTPTRFLEQGKDLKRSTADGGGRDRGATATCFVNGERVAEGRIDRTTANVFLNDE